MRACHQGPLLYPRTDGLFRHLPKLTTCLNQQESSLVEAERWQTRRKNENKNGGRRSRRARRRSSPLMLPGTASPVPIWVI
jgi:hypothetical protein